MDAIVADYEQRKSKVSTSDVYKILANVNFEPHPDSDGKIGDGSYGDVYYIENTIHKYMEYYDESGINVDNISEMILLSTFRAPCIPELYVAEMEKDSLLIIEEYCGKDLFDLGLLIPENYRYKMTPTLLLQMARILMWMKRHNLAHMDIKPENLCINQNGKLVLIDWGFGTPVYHNSAKYHGTEKYSDPNYLNRQKRASCEYDMMGMGVTLYDFLSGHAPKKEKWHDIILLPMEKQQEKLWTVLREIKTVEKNLTKYLGSSMGPIIYKLLCGMLLIDEDKRIKSHSIYTHPVFRNLWEDYPIYGECIYTNNPLLPKSFDGYERLLERYGCKSLFKDFPEVQALGVQIFYRYVINPEMKNLENYLRASIYIASAVYKQSLSTDSELLVYKKYINEVLDRVGWTISFNRLLDISPDFQRFLQQ